MEDTTFPDTQQTQELLTIALSAVGKLRETQWWRIQPGDMLSLGQQLQQLSNELYTANVNLAGELDSENIGATYACTSTAALLRQSFNISPAEAHGRVNAARKVLPRDTDTGTTLQPVLPALAAAMATGDVNSEHIKLITTTMSKLPTLLPVEDLGFWEAFMVEHASILDPNSFEKVCRSVLDKADPDGDLDESTAAAKMEFSFGHRNLRNGLTPIKGQLDDYSVEVMKKAIDGLSAPRPSTSTSGDGMGSSPGNDPGCGQNPDPEGDRDSDTINAVSCDGDNATGSPQDASVSNDVDPANDTDIDPVDQAFGSRDAHFGRTGTSAGRHCGTVVPDLRSPANRRAHGLVSALRGFLDAGLGPTQGGERPHITMVMNWDVVQGVVVEAGYDSGGAITATQARKFLCDAQIIPAVLGGKGEVLDIGRASRTFPLAIRRAIALRDGGCIWPGCDRPPGWCDCHHVEWWHRDRGDTSYQGGVMFCPGHHTEIHKGEWVVRLAADGIPELVPPKWMDSKQRALRNNMHRPLRR